MRAHPYTNKFPMLPQEELEELAESIKANGLRQPIVLDTEGRILDGRNRAAACKLAGVQPDFVTYEGDDLAEYVIDCNTSRRHMSTGARAMATALILEAEGKLQNGKWAYGLPILQNAKSTFRSALSRSAKILTFCPDLAIGVAAGVIEFTSAFQEAGRIEASVEAEKIADRNRARAAREAEKAEQERQQRLLAELQQAQATQWLREAVSLVESKLKPLRKNRTSWANHKFYRLHHTLSVLLNGLTASNITDIDLDLDEIRNELQRGNHHHGKNSNPSIRKVLESYLPALADLTQVLQHCPTGLVEEGWELSDKASDLAIELEILAEQCAPTPEEIDETRNEL